MSKSDTERGECNTVKCHNLATKRLRIESDYDSVSGETKTIVLQMDYCDEHAETHLRYNITGKRYEVIEELPQSVETDNK